MAAGAPSYDPGHAAPYLGQMSRIPLDFAQDRRRGLLTDEELERSKAERNFLNARTLGLLSGGGEAGPPEAPETIETYDERGNKQVRMWNGEEWIPVGGSAAPGAPETQGGFQWNAQSGQWEEIPGYGEQQIAAAAASAPKISQTMGPTGIDYGQPPKDTVWGRDESGKIKLEQDPQSGSMVPRAVPIPGGTVAREEVEKTEKAKAARASQQKYADIVTQDIDRLLGIIDDATIPVTGWGSLLESIPGTKARDARALADTIRANVGFERLQEMRSASLTGAGVGNVTELENALMQATLGNLELSQSEEQVKENLKRIRDIYTRIVHEGIPAEEAMSLLTDAQTSRSRDELRKKYNLE